jgi:hypothetical protein
VSFFPTDKIFIWIGDLRFDNVPFGRTQFAPTLWTKSVTVGAQSLRPLIDWDIIPTQVPWHSGEKFCLNPIGGDDQGENG